MRRRHAAMIGFALLIAAALEPATTAQPSTRTGKHARAQAAATSAKSPSRPVVTAAPVTLADIFAAARNTKETAPDGTGMVMEDFPNTDVMVVRLSPDGTREYGCVNNEASAREFLGPSKTAPLPAKAKVQ